MAFSPGKLTRIAARLDEISERIDYMLSQRLAAPADSRARWNTDAAGIEQAGAVVEIEEHMTSEQRERNAKAAALNDEVRAMALRAAAEGDAEADPDEDVAARKD